MRKLAVLVLLAAVVPSAFAAKKPLITRRVTVAQLEQEVAASRAVPDKKLAKQLADMKLTERMSDATLARLQKELPGDKAKLSLLALADESAFLDLPAAEIPSTPAPDRATQIAIVNRAMEYMLKTITKLPDFFATRITTRFEGTTMVVPEYLRDALAPDLINDGSQRVSKIETTSATVRYSKGRETFTDMKKAMKTDCKPGEITGDGEFGEILARVAYEMAHGEEVWSHWEQGRSGPMAVFRYEATFTYTSQRHCPNEVYYLPTLVHFHGEIAVNPKDGSILRLTEISPGVEFWDSHPEVIAPYAIDDLQTMVEYGPVEIGGRIYLCPVKSVFLSIWEQDSTSSHIIRSHPPSGGPAGEALNDRIFTQYHIFRARTHILTGADPVQKTTPPDSSSKPSPSKAPATSPEP